MAMLGQERNMNWGKRLLFKRTRQLIKQRNHPTKRKLLIPNVSDLHSVQGQFLRVPTRDVVPGSVLYVIRGEVYKVARGREVRGQEELPQLLQPFSCKTLIYVPEESGESASLGIPKKGKIRYMSQVVPVSAFQTF